MQPDCRPFQDRQSFEMCRLRTALTPLDEVVVVVDWERTDYDGVRVLVVRNKDTSTVVMSWCMREDLLVPVEYGPLASMLSQAESWRANQRAIALQKSTQSLPSETPRPRL